MEIIKGLVGELDSRGELRKLDSSSLIGITRFAHLLIEKVREWKAKKGHGL